MAAISQANAGLIRRDLPRLAESRRSLQNIPTQRLLEISAAAGELFLHADLPLDPSAGTKQSTQMT